MKHCHELVMIFIREQIRWKVHLFYQYLRIGSSRLAVTMSSCSLREFIKIFLINHAGFLKKTIFQMISLKTWRIQKLLEFRLSFSCFHPKKVGTAQLTRLGIPLGMELGTSGRFWFKKEGTALPKEPGSLFENVHSASFPGLFLALLRSDDWRRISWENQIIQGR